MDTLILNKDGTPLSLLPLSISNWQDSIRLAMLNKVHVLKTYEDWVVRSPSTRLHVPSIVITAEFYRWNRIVKYSRENVYLRDNYTCQLCGSKPKHSELTLDHVLPRHHGGKTTWDNIVTACKKCNETKGNKKEIKPSNMPRRPSYYEMVAKKQKQKIRIRDEEWMHYLDWPKELVVLYKPKRNL